MLHLPSGEALASFAALTFLEVILGVDNIVFLAVAIQRLAPEKRRTGRWVGLALAMVLRILMLVGMVWATGLDAALFRMFGRDVTIKDLVLAGGGLFLLAKGTGEIHDALETAAAEGEAGAAGQEGADGKPAEVRWAGMTAVVLQIGLINIVFSLDSVITAVGMTNDLPIMIAAVVASTLMMMFAAAPVGDFIARRPTTKMLALSFILLIGVALLADGVGFHIPRAYIYFAIAFSLFVEALNGVSRRRGGRRPRPGGGR
jgi:predicted tellurium resistance membrane protein TerC